MKTTYKVRCFNLMLPAYFIAEQCPKVSNYSTETIADSIQDAQNMVKKDLPLSDHVIVIKIGFNGNVGVSIEIDYQYMPCSTERMRVISHAWQDVIVLKTLGAINKQKYSKDVRERLADLTLNYLFDCKENGHSDYEVWCKDNLDRDESADEARLFDEIKDTVEELVNILFD